MRQIRGGGDWHPQKTERAALAARSVLESRIPVRCTNAVSGLMPNISAPTRGPARRAVLITSCKWNGRDFLCLAGLHISAEEQGRGGSERRHFCRMLVDIEEAGEVAFSPVIQPVRIGKGENRIPILERRVGAEQGKRLRRIRIRRSLVVFRANVGAARDALQGKSRERAAISSAGHWKRAPPSSRSGPKADAENGDAASKHGNQWRPSPPEWGMGTSRAACRR